MYKIIILLGFLLASRCGTVVSSDRYEREKSRRSETEQRLGEKSYLQAVYNGMFTNLLQTETLQWAYNEEVHISTYDKADATCKSIGFDLPTKEQVLSEGVALAKVEPLIESGQLENFIYLKNLEIKDPASHFGRLLCVRGIAEN